MATIPEDHSPEPSPTVNVTPTWISPSDKAPISPGTGLPYLAPPRSMQFKNQFRSLQRGPSSNNLTRQQSSSAMRPMDPYEEFARSPDPRLNRFTGHPTGTPPTNKRLLTAQEESERRIPVFERGGTEYQERWDFRFSDDKVAYRGKRYSKKAIDEATSELVEKYRLGNGQSSRLTNALKGKQVKERKKKSLFKPRVEVSATESLLKKKVDLAASHLYFRNHIHRQDWMSNCPSALIEMPTFSLGEFNPEHHCKTANPSSRPARPRRRMVPESTSPRPSSNALRERPSWKVAGANDSSSSDDGPPEYHLGDDTDDEDDDVPPVDVTEPVRVNLKTPGSFLPKIPEDHREHETQKMMAKFHFFDVYHNALEDPSGERGEQSGARSYLRAVESMHQWPKSLGLYNPNITTLALNEIGLTSEDVKGVATALPELSKVTTVTLSGNPMSLSSLQVILAAIAENPSVTSLDLSSTNLGLHANHLADALAPTSSLTHLNLCSNRLGGPALAKVAAVLQDKPCCVNLNLQRNRLGGSQGWEIATQLISKPLKLEEFDLSWNSLNSQVPKAFTDQLTANKSLKVLRLAWNGLRDAGVRLLAACIPSSALQTLDVSYNRFEHEGCVALALALTEASPLRHLAISGNLVGQLGFRYLLRAAVSISFSLEMNKAGFGAPLPPPVPKGEKSTLPPDDWVVKPLYGDEWSRVLELFTELHKSGDLLPAHLDTAALDFKLDRGQLLSAQSLLESAARETVSLLVRMT